MTVHDKLSTLTEVGKLDLLDILDKLSGSKALVWDESLTGPMGLIAKYSVLQEHDVVKMFPLGSGPLPHTAADNVVFITRSSLTSMDQISSCIKAAEKSGGSGVKTDFHVIFVPRKSLLCEKRLVAAGVYGSLRCHSLPIYLFPLDTDLLSMELPQAYRDITQGDPTPIHMAAMALTRLQAVTGVIPRIYGKGSSAAEVFDLMVKLKISSCGECPPTRASHISTLVLLDRGVDLISPLPTQLTYEGLIDEMFGVQCASVRLPEDDKVISLSSAEELFQELRGLNFNAVGPTLSRKARVISAQFEERHEAKTVREIKQFVDKLPGMQTAKVSLGTHTSLAEKVKEGIDSDEFLQRLELEQTILSGGVDAGRYLEELEDLACDPETSINRVLRLLCLQSTVAGGLKQKVLEQYKRLILQSYGYNHLVTLEMLAKAGLLAPTTNSRPNYNLLRKRLNLIQDNVDEQNPSDIAYVHSVYAPLSVRLVQQLEKPGWRNIRDVLDTIPGANFEDTQQVPPRHSSVPNSSPQKVVLVFFVGGVTMAEIAALRFLSQQEDSSIEYLIGTTSVITGDTFIQSLSTTLEAPAF